LPSLKPLSLEVVHARGYNMHRRMRVHCYTEGLEAARSTISNSSSFPIKSTG
jgi:hypothetical protein